MVLAKSLYDSSHHILLSDDHALTDQHIHRIHELGFQGVYIKWQKLKVEMDTAKELVSTELKEATIRIVKDIYYMNIKDNGQRFQEQRRIEKIVQELIQQLLNSEELLLNLYDLKTYNQYTFQHSANVTVLALIMGIQLGFSKEELRDLGLGALTHDLGKRFIDIEILNKEDSLNDDEMEKIKQHTLLGEKIMGEVFEVSERVRDCALSHHERVDGSGYPNGLKGEEISLFSRIIAICDVFDALVANRCYRSATPQHEALSYIKGKKGSHFDERLVDLFVKHVPYYPLGTVVKLSNGKKGVVVANKIGQGMRPVVKIIFDHLEGLIAPYDIDLTDQINISIDIKEIVVDVCKIN